VDWNDDGQELTVDWSELDRGMDWITICRKRLEWTDCKTIVDRELELNMNWSGR